MLGALLHKISKSSMGKLPWPLKNGPDQGARMDWLDGERDEFNRLLGERKYSACLEILRNKAPQCSLREMMELMKSFEDMVANYDQNKQVP